MNENKKRIEENSEDQLIHFDNDRIFQSNERIKIDKVEDEQESERKESDERSPVKTLKTVKGIKLDINLNTEIDYDKEDPDINFLLEPIRREESIRDYKSCQSLPKLTIGQRITPFRFPINSSEFDQYFSQITPNSESVFKNLDSIGENKSMFYGMDQSNISIFSNQDLIKEIKDCPRNGQVYLPPTIIYVPFFYITKPMSIIGKPGTKLVFTENSFIIDFEPEDENESFEISEVNLEMDFFKKSTIPNFGGRLSTDERKSLPDKNELFKVNPFVSKYHSLSLKSQNTTPSILKDFLIPFFIIKGNSKVELRDCIISIHEKIPQLIRKHSGRASTPKIKFEESKKVEYRRIISNSNGNSIESIQIAFLLEKKKNKFPKLALYSCNVTGFSQVCECENNSSLLLERSRFLDIKYHAVNVSNPFELQIVGCNFNKIGLSCLNIRISRQVQELRKILIAENEFYDSNYGISYFSETKDFISYFTELIDNKCSYTLKDGFRFKNLNIIGLEIFGNEIKAAKRNGIFLEGDYNHESDIPIMVKKNKITYCENHGIYIQDSMVTIEENTVLVNTIGGIMIEGVLGMAKSRVILANLNVNQNLGFGVLIKGLFNSCLRISNSIFMENQNGIVYETIGKNSQHFLSNNKIVNNFETGIKIMQLNGKIYFVDNYFEGNGVCEIHSNLQNNSNLNFSNQKIKKFNSSNSKKNACSVF